MSDFFSGHATHPDWRVALSLAGAQIDAQRARAAETSAPLTLGFAYFTDVYAPQAAALVAALKARWPGVAWVGSVGVGVAASGVEYIDEPALVLLLGTLAPQHFEVFSGVRPLTRIVPFCALVHADPGTPDIAELIGELADRTSSGYVFGGLAASRTHTAHVADGVFQGGLSGVAFSAGVPLVSRVTQGCQPVGPVRSVTEVERNIVVALDGAPAMDALFADLGIEPASDARAALPRLRATLVGLSDGDGSVTQRGGAFGPDVRVRHLIGLDPARRAVAVADIVEPGMRLAFCTRDVQAARRDLVRICSEIREETEAPAALAAHALAAAEGAPARPIRGAIYVSCAGRGGPHFGGPSAELKIVQHALGDVPLAGFFAGGEIARRHLYGYTGVLTVFTDG
jgi:small ligand-binding sensory domain FIST